MKIKHILKTKEFADILGSGERTRGKTLAVYVRREKSAEDSLAIGVVVSKKFVPKAVTRNYIRRVIYASFRESGFSPEGGVSIIARAIRTLGRDGKKSLSKEIRAEIKTLTSRAGIGR